MIEQINVGVIGTGWCGGIRTKACSDNPLVDKLFIAEINDVRRAEVAEQYGVQEAFSDWQNLIVNPDIDTIIISATPETTHYPMALAALQAGKNVFMELRLRVLKSDLKMLLEIVIKIKYRIKYI